MSIFVDTDEYKPTYVKLSVSSTQNEVHGLRLIATLNVI